MNRFSRICIYAFVGWCVFTWLAPPSYGWLSLTVRGKHGSVVGARAVDGTRLLANLDGQLTLLDVADPSQPTLTDYMVVDLTAQPLLVGHYAYVLAPAGLSVLDLADPAH